MSTNVRISKKGKKLLNNRSLAKKIAIAIAANPEKLYTKEGLVVYGLVIRSVTVVDIETRNIY